MFRLLALVLPALVCQPATAFTPIGYQYSYSYDYDSYGYGYSYSYGYAYAYSYSYAYAYSYSYAYAYSYSYAYAYSYSYDYPAYAYEYSYPAYAYEYSYPAYAYAYDYSYPAYAYSYSYPDSYAYAYAYAYSYAYVYAYSYVGYAYSYSYSYPAYAYAYSYPAYAYDYQYPAYAYAYDYQYPAYAYDYLYPAYAYDYKYPAYAYDYLYPAYAYDYQYPAYAYSSSSTTTTSSSFASTTTPSTSTTTTTSTTTPSTSTSTTTTPSTSPTTTSTSPTTTSTSTTTTSTSTTTPSTSTSTTTTSTSTTTTSTSTTTTSTSTTTTSTSSSSSSSSSTTSTGSECLDNCFGYSCNYWLEQGELCSKLESVYQCNCNNCDCGVEGCTDPDACNYDSTATVDDDSCAYTDTCGICGGDGVGGSTAMCEKKAWRNDNYCDDGNNNCGCGWDGGDCCGNENTYAFCEDCLCLDPDYSHCGGFCGLKQLQGDGYCDDNNNNCGCDWDGGDCCGSANTYTFCATCECLDPSFVATTTTMAQGCGGSDCSGKCEKNAWQGDGICDDGNNVCGCNWDGGDCCGTDSSYYYCTDCECLDCDYSGGGDDCVDSAVGNCLKEAWRGDGYCDDGNNNAACDWDGGDCCGAAVIDDFCTACECLDCTATTSSDDCVDNAQGECGSAKYVGDGYCDDDNNNAGCGWDDGDCCGTSDKTQQFAFCSDCDCLDCTYVVESACVDAVTGQCEKVNWQGDGYCDDGNNNAGCDWDGGDCCSIDASFDFCQACECLDCEFSGELNDCGHPMLQVCDKPAWQGDGYCDDNNNHAGCDWDGGDCCGGSTALCSECVCKDCSVDCGSTCQEQKYKGDGYCDDGNNVCGCDWDGGDCCGVVKQDFCEDCVCLDPTKTCPGTNECEKNGWYGDGICDDGNNNCGCGWDGGDCCGSSGEGSQYTFCSDCTCLESRA